MRDPDSTKITGFRRGEVSKRCTKPPLQVRDYWMQINSKNGYGGYTGDKPYRCTTDIDETKIIDIHQIGEGEPIPPEC